MARIQKNNDGTRTVFIEKDGKEIPWNDFKECNPLHKGNNESRTGFSWNPYTSAMGRLFQETVKKWLIAGLRRVHDKEIPKYDPNKTPYVYDDPRLALLDQVMKGAVIEHFHDNDIARKHEVLNNMIDVCLYMCKEDIFYRARLFKSFKNLSEAYLAAPDMFDLTDSEDFNYQKFRLENWEDNTLHEWTFQKFMEQKHGKPETKTE